MKPNSKLTRCEELALYLIENQSTVRETASHFGVSKSTVHKDVTERLKRINLPLYVQTSKVLDKNKSERHIRGGIATKNKYAKLKSANNKKQHTNKLF